MANAIVSDDRITKAWEKPVNKNGKTRLYSATEIVPLAMLFALVGVVSVNIAEAAIAALLRFPRTEAQFAEEPLVQEPVAITSGSVPSNQPVEGSSSVTFTLHFRVDQADGSQGRTTQGIDDNPS